MNTRKKALTSALLIDASTEQNKAWRVILIDACMVLAVFVGYIMVVEPENNKGLRFIHQLAAIVGPEHINLAAPTSDIVYPTHVSGPASDALLELEVLVDRSLRSYGVSGVKTARVGGNSLSIVISSPSYFKTDSHALTPELTLALDIIGSRIWADQTLTAAVFDHGDGMMPLSQEYVSAGHLSNERAAVARERIVEHSQVAFDRVLAAGMSDQRPIASNNTAAGRQANSRLEVVLTIDLAALPKQDSGKPTSDWREALERRVDAGKAGARQLSNATIEWMISMGLR